MTFSREPCVYILASRRNGTLYVGVTANLPGRIWEHRNGVAESFTKRHGVRNLVWYERHDSMLAAIGREKALKEWRRSWKIALIEQMNPDWKDLSGDL
ncbi:MAG: GIY-YIG nuclease family protein [Candidatus Sericytochromatia bacterium]|nr:GIY-YIG nuclease family protein [Candidatus Tanganyikabacteria bacterium]